MWGVLLTGVCCLLQDSSSKSAMKGGRKAIPANFVEIIDTLVDKVAAYKGVVLSNLPKIEGTAFFHSLPPPWYCHKWPQLTQDFCQQPADLIPLKASLPIDVSLTLLRDSGGQTPAPEAGPSTPAPPAMTASDPLPGDLSTQMLAAALLENPASAPAATATLQENEVCFDVFTVHNNHVKLAVCLEIPPRLSYKSSTSAGLEAT